jgi:hypothetical protein
MQSHDLLSVFLVPITHCGIEYMVTGSVASTLYGEPRLTHDIDLVLVLKLPDIEKFLSCFPSSDYYCPPPEVIRIELQRNLIHHNSGYKADCYPFTGNPLHAWALKHKREIPVRPDLVISTAPPEYVIIRKLQFFREGGSEKHLHDIRKMISALKLELDREILHKWIDRLSLEKEWEKIEIQREIDMD